MAAPARGTVVRGQPSRGLVLKGQGAGTSGDTFSGSVGRFAQRAPGRMRGVAIGAALLYAQAVTVGNAWSTGTPVRTGYARGSWVASLSTRSNALPLGVRPSAPADGRAVAVAPSPMAAIGAVIRRWDPFAQPLWLQNNSAYIGYLEYGLTVPLAADTPSGWVGIADRQWPAMVGTVNRTLRDEVGRLSAQNYAFDADRAVAAGDRL